MFISFLSQAIADLTKALEFERNSADVLHERGSVLKIVNYNERILKLVIHGTL